AQTSSVLVLVLEPIMASPVHQGIDRYVGSQDFRVGVHHLARGLPALVLLVANARGGDQQDPEPELAARPEAAAAAGPRHAAAAGQRAGEVGLFRGLGLQSCQCLLPRELQAISGAGPHGGRAPIQIPGDLPGEVVVVSCHSLIPLAVSISASAWTAREQWVLTLPSEQPIAAAASATSSSSQ